MSIDISKFTNKTKKDRYDGRIQLLKSKNFYTENIEETVKETIDNIFQKNVRNLVIYGEPQSGKTELMIALTAKLLDMGKKHIIIVVHDNVKLLEQNLTRFFESSLSPAPMEHDEFSRSSTEFKEKEFIVCSKKNKNNLERLIEKIGSIDDVIVIDDECDHSTPNSKINKDLKSKINELIEKVFSKNGHWIGVSATPGRVDLNQTFHNDNQKWVSFKPHPNYYGQDHFFPMDYMDFDEKSNDEVFKFNFYPLSDVGPDNSSDTRDALFRYMIRVAIKNLKAKRTHSTEGHFSMIIHTSGEKESHARDFRIVERIFDELNDETTNGFKRNLERINDLIPKITNDFSQDEILHFIMDHRQDYKPVVMNSDKDLRSPNADFGLKPKTVFTIIIGGNIISRGLTFDNLLSMYFSRDVKNKITIDTYVQRARMFGNRENVYKDFELAIPRTLYDDWWTAFYNHRASLVTINNFIEPIWISDSKTRTTAPSSINKAAVDISRGEIAFKIFDFDNQAKSDYEKCTKTDISRNDILQLQKTIGEDSLRGFFLDEALKRFDVNKNKVHFQNIRAVGNDWDKEILIRPRKGVIDKPENKNPVFSFALFYYNNKARIFFKCTLSKTYLKRIK